MTEAAMPFARMGDSGLVVSRLALGTMTFTLGSDWIPGIARVDQKLATEMVAKAIDHGVNFFDSADGYSQGDAETALGVALEGRREDMVICTKFGFRQGAAITRAGLSRRHAMASVEGSLRRLKTDWIDLYVCHKDDFTAPMEETLRALDDLVRSGKVRYLGFSNWPAWAAARAVQFQRDNGLAPFVTGQMLYSLVTRDIEVGVLPMMRAMGVGLMAWSPLAQGLLSGKYTRETLGQAGSGRLADFDNLKVDRPTAFAALDALSDIASTHGTSVPQVALGWVLAKPGATGLIVGANRMAHLDDALGAVQVGLTAEEMARLDATAPPYLTYPESFLAIRTDQRIIEALGRRPA